MDKKFSLAENHEIPRASEGIQVNCCKTPACKNFGLTPEYFEQTEEYKNATKKAKERGVRAKNPFYTVTSSANKISNIKCKGCIALNQSSEKRYQISHIIKSNLAVTQELNRISSYLTLPGEQCPNKDCLSNQTKQSPSIKKRGFTKARRQRFQCKLCGTCFTDVPGRHRNQPRSEINKTVFKCQVRGVSLRSLAEIVDVSMQTIYDRIDFLHEQCMRFVAERVRKLCELNVERLYLSTDRQVQVSNWTNREDRKNCEFYGIATADSYSSYVFAFNFNYDPEMNPELVNKHAEGLQEMEKRPHHRWYARVWLEDEFKKVSTRSLNEKELTAAGSLDGEIELKVAFNEVMNESKSSELFDKTTKLPLKGMEVHNEYTMIAHFFF